MATLSLISVTSVSKSPSSNLKTEKSKPFDPLNRVDVSEMIWNKQKCNRIFPIWLYFFYEKILTASEFILLLMSYFEDWLILKAAQNVLPLLQSLKNTTKLNDPGWICLSHLQVFVGCQANLSWFYRTLQKLPCIKISLIQLNFIKLLIRCVLNFAPIRGLHF